MKKELYIGVMSGTSLDGIDIALCAFSKNSVQLLHAHEYPFKATIKKKILRVLNKKKTSLEDIGTLDTALGMMYAQTINKFLKKFAIKPHTIKAIALHGQTLWHHPHPPHPFSMQLGNSAVVATLTNIPVCYDFRAKDIALGGEGAPFAPAFHKFLFHKHKKSAVINIGGMANITLLEKKVKGWDVGCGNVLLDSYIAKIKNKPFDKDGAFAQSGTADTQLLKIFLTDPYFHQTPPKSTGREYFNLDWLEQKLYLRRKKLLPQDIQATLVELVAITLADAIKNKNITTLILCGGGAKNGYLYKRIAYHSQCKVYTSDHFGFSGDFLEAMLFAWLGYNHIHKRKTKLKTITGAKKNTVLGAYITP